MPSISLKLNETTHHPSHSLPAACGVQRISSPLSNGAAQSFAEERSAMMEQKKESAEKPVSNGVHLQAPSTHQKDFCESGAADKISSFQMTILYARSWHNRLEYDTRILETLRNDCIAYIQDYFTEIVALCSPATNHNVSTIIIVCFVLILPHFATQDNGAWAACSLGQYDSVRSGISSFIDHFKHTIQH